MLTRADLGGFQTYLLSFTHYRVCRLSPNPIAKSSYLGPVARLYVNYVSCWAEANEKSKSTFSQVIPVEPTWKGDVRSEYPFVLSTTDL